MSEPHPVSKNLQIYLTLACQLILQPPKRRLRDEYMNDYLPDQPAFTLVRPCRQSSGTHHTTYAPVAAGTSLDPNTVSAGIVPSV